MSTSKSKTTSTTRARAAVLDIAPHLERRAREHDCPACGPGHVCPPHRCAAAVTRLRDDLAACVSGQLVVSVSDVRAAVAAALADLEQLATDTMPRGLGPANHDMDGDLLELDSLRRTP